MNLDTAFASVRTDTGIVSEILHVSPVFMRCGPPRRGSFALQRLARARRTDARQERRAASLATQFPVAGFFDRFSA